MEKSVAIKQIFNKELDTIEYSTQWWKKCGLPKFTKEPYVLLDSKLKRKNHLCIEMVLLLVISYFNSFENSSQIVFRGFCERILCSNMNKKQRIFIKLYIWAWKMIATFLVGAHEITLPSVQISASSGFLNSFKGGSWWKIHSK